MKINNPIETVKKTEYYKMWEKANYLVSSGLYEDYNLALLDTQKWFNKKEKGFIEELSETDVLLLNYKI